MERQPLLLYSANTWLAYSIAQQYYNAEHYVWCCPHFDRRSLATVDVTTPPTSTPSDIYVALQAEVSGGDRHSARIASNTAGLLAGAVYKKDAGVISDDQYNEIRAAILSAETRDFRPLLYVIPFSLVSSTFKRVPVEKRAHPLSVEYIIDRLPRSSFDVLVF